MFRVSDGRSWLTRLRIWFINWVAPQSLCGRYVYLQAGSNFIPGKHAKILPGFVAKIVGYSRRQEAHVVSIATIPKGNYGWFLSLIVDGYDEVEDV